MPVELRPEARAVRRRHSGPRRLPVVRDEVLAGAVPRADSIPPVVTAFRAVDGSIHHARCAHRIDFVGMRGGVELDFYCLACREHVTLTDGALERLAVGRGAVS
jgi:hypothetical protein